MLKSLLRSLLPASAPITSIRSGLSAARQVLLVVTLAAAPALAQQKPNVLFILTDDLDTALLQAGLDAAIYPHLKRVLIDAGTRFTESFVSNSLCCPSRATYLSGQYSHNNGVFSNSGPFGGFTSFDDSSTLATWMLGAGYRTGHVGKYLNGYKDYRYVPPGWTTWNATVGGSAQHRLGADDRRIRQRSTGPARRIRQMNKLKRKLDQLRGCGGAGAQTCAAAEN
jgi:Sulfatase